MREKVQCPFCLENFVIEVFPEDGEIQEFVFDCEICCNPINIIATWDQDEEKMTLLAQKSD
jgi:hypothetical protein